MKVTTLRLAVASAVAAAFVVSTTNLQAQHAPPPPNPYQYQFEPNPSGPFYIGFDVGGTIMQDLHLKNLPGTMTMDPGMRGSFVFGYNFCHPLAVEFETAGIWNQVQTVANAPVTDSGFGRADLYQVPFLANLVYCVPLNGGFCFYIAGGCGGIATTLDLSDNSNFFDSHHHDSDTDFTFAYQGKTGVEYWFAPNMGVDVSYKFLGTLDHTWFNDNPGLFLNTGPAYTHSFVASFTWRF